MKFLSQASGLNSWSDASLFKIIQDVFELKLVNGQGRKATGQQIIRPLIAEHAESEKLLYACAYMYEKCIT